MKCDNVQIFGLDKSWTKVLNAQTAFKQGVPRGANFAEIFNFLQNKYLFYVNFT